MKSRTGTRREVVKKGKSAGEIVIVGTGVAGLSAALGAAESQAVTLLTKNRLGMGGSSPWAQGGVAAAVGPDDSPALHAADTLGVGCGINDPAMVSLLAQEAWPQIRRLMEIGVRFDGGTQGGLSLGREAGHSRRRILHAGGDATGAEMVRGLVDRVRRHPAIRVEEEVTAGDLLLVRGQRVAGVVASEGAEGPGRRTVVYPASAVVLATGGLGQLFSHTTNPQESTGDGLAMAARAGARLADLEFVQFHPTALDCGRDPMPLLTEALRGEGGLLVNEGGERFMVGQHPDSELAPRDVVARAIWRQLCDGHRVFLDLRPLGPGLEDRFPTAMTHCRRAGLDPLREPVPIAPAAHYHMGGIAVDAWGRTSLPGLWACGEVASTGAHGANRLASNSLSEGLIMGARVAEDLSRSGYREAADLPLPRLPPVGDGAPAVRSPRRSPDEAAAVSEVRDLMWTHVGLERDAGRLASAIQRLQELAADLPPGEAQNRVLVGRLLATAALLRRESRGSHFRSDFAVERRSWRRRLFLSLAQGEVRQDPEPLPTDSIDPRRQGARHGHSPVSAAL